MVGNRSAVSGQVLVDREGNAGNLFIPHSLGPPMVWLMWPLAWM